MKIGNYGYTPNNNVNKFNNKEALQQPTIQSPQESSLQRGRELAAKVLGDKMAEQLVLPFEKKQADKPLFDFDEIVKQLKSNFKIKYFNLINLRTDAYILEKKLPAYCKLSSFSEYSILQLEKGVFPDNYSQYKSKQKTEFRRIIKKHKDKKHELIDCNILDFPISEIETLRDDMIQLGFRDENYLLDNQLLLIEELYNKGKIILSIVKTNNKINAVSFVIKDSTQYLTWIDMFDNSKMINIFNYISLITVLSSEESVIINFGRGVYGYKMLNFIPQSKDLFSLQIFSSKWQELKYNHERNIVWFLRGVYKMLKK